MITTLLKNTEKDIASVKSKIKSCPNGELRVTHNSKYYKFFQCVNGTYHYIPKKNRKVAQKLAYKLLLEAHLDDLEHKIIALEHFLEEYVSYNNKSNHLLSVPPIRDLVTEYVESSEIPIVNDPATEWASSDYPKNTFYPEHLIHKSISGNYLRSKSEVLIDMCLHKHKLAFRYECALNIENKTIYPDFTILHPITGEQYYWEHYGLIDNPTYLDDYLTKQRLYLQNNFIPTHNLIQTFETSNLPLTIDIIEKTINYYFFS